MIDASTKAETAKRFAADFEAAFRRRQALATRPHRFRQRDYVVSLGSTLALPIAPAPVKIRLSYVPDRLVLDRDCFEPYLARLAAEPWTGIEEAMTAFLGDIANEVVPFWAHLSATTRIKSDGDDDSHTIAMEDRQPNWDNPDLLARFDRA
jgi:hypothetical protein